MAKAVEGGGVGGIEDEDDRFASGVIVGRK